MHCSSDTIRKDPRYAPESFLGVRQHPMLRSNLCVARDSGRLDPITGIAAVSLDGDSQQGPVLPGPSFLTRIKRGLTPVMSEDCSVSAI